MKTRFSKAEWDFSAVEPCDLRACCFYEYFREIESPPFSVSFPFSGLRDATGNAPWSRLTAEQRAIVAESVECFRQLRPSPHAITLIDEDQIRISAEQFRSIPIIPGVRAGLLGSATVSLLIDLRNRRDDEIVSEFRSMLRALRSNLVARFGPYQPAFTGPGKKGSKYTAWRSHLDNLGWMRLRHSLGKGALLRAVATHSNKCWGNAADEEEIIQSIDKHRDRVLAVFREMFPELGAKAEPARWRKFGR